ncbi:MAG: hypothetical protein ABIG28_03475 [archaeon]
MIERSTSMEVMMKVTDQLVKYRALSAKTNAFIREFGPAKGIHGGCYSYPNLEKKREEIPHRWSELNLGAPYLHYPFLSSLFDLLEPYYDLEGIDYDQPQEVSGLAA